MANPSKRKGTAGETAIVNYLRENGWPHAERRTLAGVHDKGDIAGIVGVCIEAKATKAFTPAQFLKEVEVEKANAKAAVGFAWVKKAGTTNPGEWYVLMSGAQVVQLLKEAGY